MSTLKFLGTHTGSLPTLNNQEPTTSTSKPYWHIWFNQTDQNYIVQALNQAKTPINAPVIISPLVFGLNFIEENDVSPPPPNPSNIATLRHHDLSTTIQYTKKTIAIGKKEKGTENNATKIENDNQLEPTSLSPESDSHTYQDATGTSNFILTPKDEIKEKLHNSKALRLNKECRDYFLSAMTMWKQGRKGVAAVKFDSLLKKDAPFIEAHKHMFTECAVQLRKIQQNDLALAFAIKCIQLSPTDSHAHFNVGRMHYELKNYKDSLSFIEDALKLEPDLAPALKLKKIETELLNRATKYLG